MNQPGERIRQFPRARLSPLLAVALAVAAFATLVFAREWSRATALNRDIADLRAGKDIKVEPNARPELLLARMAFLLHRDEFDAARVIAAALDRTDRDDLAARGRYLLGNAQLRRGFALIQAADLENAGLFVNLAKRDYRKALQRAPGFWDAKYNFDVASRLMRDYPNFAQDNGDDMPADPKKIWTDLPGAPQGLP